MSITVTCHQNNIKPKPITIQKQQTNDNQEQVLVTTHILEISVMLISGKLKQKMLKLKCSTNKN